jgi:hypothetical protein
MSARDNAILGSISIGFLLAFARLLSRPDSAFNSPTDPC